MVEGTSDYIYCVFDDNVSLNNNDLEKLKEVLSELEISEVLPYLIESKITYRSLRYLSKEDIYRAMPNDIGLCSEFRKKLFFWRKKTFGEDDETFSDASNNRVSLWVESQNSSTPSSICGSYLDVKDILQKSELGQGLIEFYKQKQSLTDHQRDDIIRKILETVHLRKISLGPSHFRDLVRQITEVFPNEATYAEYYYVPRQKKQNPRGRLYDRYRNSKAKLVKVYGKENISTHLESDDTEDLERQIGLKTLLQRSSEWEEVVKMWKDTYELRKRDIKQLNNIDFMNAWPKLLDGRAPELINIDFEIFYPAKKNELFANWNKFKEKLKCLYGKNLKSQTSIALFNSSKSAANLDSEDYILTILLNHVIKPTARLS